MSIEKKIVVKADVKASLSGMDKVVSNLKNGLKNQKYDLSKNTGLAKLIRQYEEAKNNFDSLVGSGSVEVGMSDKAIKAGEKTVVLYKQIGQAIKNLQGKDASVLKSVFPDNFSAKIDKGTAAIDNFFKKLNDKKIKNEEIVNTTKDVNRLQTELDELKTRRLKIEVDSDLTKARKDLKDFQEMRENLLKQVRDNLTRESVDSSGKTKTQRLEDDAEAKSSRFRELEKQESELQRKKPRELTSQEKGRITRRENQLKDPIFKAEQEAAKETLTRYAKERTQRTQEKANGETDRREKRAMRNISDVELDKKIAQAQKQYDAVVAKKNRLEDEIKKIESTPKKEKEKNLANLATEKKKAKQEKEAAEKELENYRAQRKLTIDAADKTMEKFQRGESPIGIDQSDVQTLADINEELQKAETHVANLKNEKSFASQEDKDSRVGKKEHDLAAKQLQLEKFKNELQQLDKMTNIDEVFRKLEQLNIPTDGIERTKQGLENLKKDLRDLDSKTVEKIRQALKNMGISADQADAEVEELVRSLGDIDNQAKGIKQAEAEMEQLKDSFLQFFSIGNSIQLFKQTIQSAINTIKELDAAMTETAVVTDFSVGDMWEKLPDYADEASKLGASITDLYSATTLYYQQGLRTAEAMQVGTETVKMARVASMDAATATQAMTAALRGFNMEIGEMDAKRVNDVYSELAAITAADTSQIAKAMTKTASIAAGANMEFETTAALLAQIIETTQEAPETAGTAMKTIVARFSEVKKLRDKNEFIGKDEEGEEINVNNIDKALRTVGISMKGFFEGTEGLDSVLLKLAEKWNTLDFETQRYIATTAAGSRQQSRFIAMMSDYGRTMELVDAANNSAGASQEQYEKTLDSLESKLNKLKNAWDTFTMGLANDEAVKAGVDIVTTLLETINKVIDVLSGGSGLRKSIISLGAAFGVLKTGSGIFGAFFKTAQDAAEAGGNVAAGDFFKSFLKTADEKMQVTDFLKGFVPKKAKIKKILSEPISEALTKIDFNKISNKKKEKLFASLLQDFDSQMPDSAQFDDGEVKRSEYMKDLQQLFKDGKPEEAIQKMEEYGEKCNKTFEISNDSAALMADNVVSKFGMASAAVGGLAVALGAVSKILEETGHQEGAKIFQVWTTGATALAGVLSVLPGLFQAVGVSIASIPIIGWIAAIVTALISIAVTVDEFVETSAEKTERLRKEAEAARQAAEDATAAYEELMSSWDQYGDTQKTLHELIKGTDEWKRALVDANNEVLKLLGTYPELAKYIETGEFGQLIINEKGWKKIAEKQEKAVKNSLILSTTKDVEKMENDKILKANAIAAENDAWAAEFANLYEAYKDYPQLFADISSGETEKVSKILSDYGISNMSYEEITELSGAIAEYDEYVRGVEQQISGLRAGALRANASEQFLNYQYSDQIMDIFSKNQETLSYQNEESILASNLDRVGSSDLQRIATSENVAVGGRKKTQLEDLQKVYASMAGIEISEIPEEMANDTKALADAIAKMDVAKKHREAMEEFQDSMANLAEEDQKLLSSLLSGSTAGLTIKELENFNKKDITTYAQKMGYTGKDGVARMAEALRYQNTVAHDVDYETQKAYAKQESGISDEKEFDFDEFLQNNPDWAETTMISAEFQLEYDMQRAKDKIQAEYNEATKVIGEESLKYVENAAIETVISLSKQIAPMGATAAENYLSAWSTVISDSNLNAVTSKQMASYLSTIDWSSMTQAVEAMDYMQSEGIDSKAIEEYWRAATEGSHTYITSLQEILNLTARIQKKTTETSELEKRLIEGKGTSQDLEDLINAGADIESFQMTPDGWYATEEAIKEATDKLKEYNAEQAVAIAKRQAEEYSWIQKIEGAEGSAPNGFQRITTVGEDGTYVAGTITSREQAVSMAYLLELEAQGEKEDEAKFIERIQQAYENYVNLLNNGELYQVAADKAAAMAQAARFNTDAAAMQGHTEESVRYSMQNEAKEEELDVQEVTAYADALGEIPDIEQAMADRIAIDNARMNKGVADLADGYGDWKSAIEDGPTSLKYQSSVKGLEKAVQDLLGTNVKLSKEWLTNKDNMKLFEKAAEGDTKAIEQIRKSAAKEVVMQAALKDGSVDTIEQQLLDVINNFDGEEIKIGTSLEDTELYSFFDQMLATGKMTASQVQAALDQIGFEPKLETETYQLQQQDYARGYVQVPQVAEDGTVTYKAQTLTSEMRTAGSITIPKIVGKNSDGSGGYQSISGTYRGSADATVNPPKDKKTGSKKKDWENPYDKHYNTLEQINEALREREKLERRYQKLLGKQGTLATNLIANSEKELAVLRQERGLQQDLIEKRKIQIKEQLSKDGLSKYASATENEFGEIEVRINWDKINAIKDEEKGSKIEEGISKIEGWRDDINGAKDALDDIEDATEEIRSRGKDEYFDLETRIKDALVQAQQDEIDKLSEINNSINDTNARLLETMQYNLEQERQMRENDKTEQELEDKQRRLEYLSQDTSGANALEIKQLEEEIAEGQQDYTDTLIDQKISELQHQNDIAAEQRQRQIDIAQSQLDHWVNTGGIWSDVYKLMDTGIGADGGIKIGSDLQKLLLSEENYNSLSTLDKVKWGKELATTAAQAVHWLKVGNSTESLIASKELKAGQSITFKTSDGKTLTGKLSSNGDIVAGGKTYKDVHLNYDGTYTTDETSQSTERTSQSKTSTTTKNTGSSNTNKNNNDKVSQQPTQPTQPTKDSNTYEGHTGKKIQVGDKHKISSIRDKRRQGIPYSEIPGLTTGRIPGTNDQYGTYFIDGNGITWVFGRYDSGSIGSIWYKNGYKKVNQYKTGGLADYTGPAWLDGTKSKPELVLNAQDTQNFIQLKNVLASLMSSSSKTTENSGDSTYDIDINVERISSDYDVEQMAEKIKDLINQDARYRNNNIAGLMR